MLKPALCGELRRKLLNWLRRIFATGDATAIRELQKKADENLRPVYQAAAAGGAKVFVPIKADGYDLYLSRVPGVKSASVWFKVVSSGPASESGDSEHEKKVTRTISMGSYSSVAGLATLNRWSVTSSWTLTVASVFAIVVETITWRATNALAVRVSRMVFERSVRRFGIAWASRFGRFAKAVVRVGPATIAFLAIEGLAWVGIRRYAVTYKIYNFDDRAWKVEKVHGDNIELGEGVKLEGVTLQAKLKASKHLSWLTGYAQCSLRSTYHRRTRS